MAKRIPAEEIQGIDILEELKKHEEVVITEDGKPIARVLPIEHADRGPMHGRIKFLGDIVEPLDEDWKATAG